MALLSSVKPQQGINFRDMAGLPGRDGRRIRAGCLFRSGALNELNEEDLVQLAALPLIHVVDYRDHVESERHPDRLWTGAIYHAVPANPLHATVSASLDSLVSEAIHDFDAVAFMLELYRLLPFKNPAYQHLSALLRDPATTSLVQHCAVGKDRTGIGSALLLFALGASKQTVMEDYLLTQTALAPFRERMLSGFAGKLDEDSLGKLNYVLSVHPSCLQVAIDEIERQYGSIDSWLALEYQLDDVACAALQQRFLLP
ncbi:C4-dicarboxylate ABC transporter [Erwinia sp. OLTSP20]|uniref:tyrosine-protein phosphatase n=1 Tax=unclassified Erwinia TaxID=2622719 RepID=UPI000C19D119|nr:MULTISPECIES: tyrosine-protein phosphatase [unclassified Erwinia]PIJ50801.1 C4-dicarboxylate ABC transporter [Erwinia sp. OAMSP11]PIJ72953.1 C4-dicarboxylate ABC transporter [Erwinia sp. OLSSP12]PIJ81968.1 C4-dicarboxylate ABC transporter [Erwinia sp. OLCASP19]PIJ84623.1 C4-dicarboxylate ABC transporter [Erwinia sp. OLMTSP26]PIJ86971.1 C4-dicarboxylate ABC transporter [Erwinia sp. OLMDSP33]